MEVKERAIEPEYWLRLRRTAVGLLAKRGHKRAAGLLDTCGFDVHKGTNDFGDEFLVLFRTVTLDEYLRFESYSTEPTDRGCFSEIAKTVTEIGQSIRFIAVELEKGSGPQAVASPQIEVSSAAVERALIDAEQLIRSSGAISAVDRVHTALHGYLRWVCVDAGIVRTEDQCGLNEAIKYVRERHPKFVTASTHGNHTEKILKAMSAVTDALGTLRNHGSVAHANDVLLDETDAMLAINSARTILHYVHSKIHASQRKEGF